MVIFPEKRTSSAKKMLVIINLILPRGCFPCFSKNILFFEKQEGYQEHRFNVELYDEKT